MRRPRWGLVPPRSMSASSKAAMAASIFPASFVTCAAREGGAAPLLTSSWRSPDLSGGEAELPLLDTERNDGEANVTHKRCTRKLHKPFLVIRSLRSTSKRTAIYMSSKRCAAGQHEWRSRQQ